MVEDIVVGSKNAVGEPVVAHELPDVFDRVEFGRFGWQRHQGDVVRDVELVREVPAGLVEQQHGVGSGGDGLGDFFQMQRHGGGIAARQNEAGCGSLSRTDGTEDVGGARALIVWCRGPCPAPRPSPCDLVFLADPGLVLKPDLYRLADCLATSDLVEALGKVFLNVAMASAS
jgi:hypothetical protein